MVIIGLFSGICGGKNTFTKLMEKKFSIKVINTEDLQYNLLEILK